MTYAQFRKKISAIRRQQWEFIWCFAKMRKFIDRHELLIDVDQEAEALGARVRHGDRVFADLLSFDNPLKEFT